MAKWIYALYRRVGGKELVLRREGDEEGDFWQGCRDSFD